MTKYRAGIIGATGMVGQRFITLLENHPWFDITLLAASPRSAGKSYTDAVGDRWAMPTKIPEKIKNMIVLDGIKVVEIASKVDMIFCAIDLDKKATKKLEEDYAKQGIAVISNNSANRHVQDVPMVIPEINPQHIEVIKTQRERLGTKTGFIAVKPNCSIQSYVPALEPLKDLGIDKVLACTYQAISGAGKNFGMWPEMVDNVIPYIGGEEEKSENEPLKIWGEIVDGMIVDAVKPSITAQCFRVAALDGHMAAVFVTFDKKTSKEEIIAKWRDYKTLPQELNLPSAPIPFLYYFDEPDRPQTRLDRDLGDGMAVSIGRLREDSQYDYKFACLSHNTLRGAAGGGVLIAELLAHKGYIAQKDYK